jgi:hypothetical protein
MSEKYREEIDEQILKCKKWLTDPELHTRNWDSYNADPISDEAIRNSIKILEYIRHFDCFGGVFVSPAPSGSIIIEVIGFK